MRFSFLYDFFQIFIFRTFFLQKSLSINSSNLSFFFQNFFLYSHRTFTQIFQLFPSIKILKNMFFDFPKN